ncbi:hypothetical protein M441DRAFT_316953 [Trichoderma asperellum CBS 433.97]|uniref:Uncharacterized protein n=1 Tax=Trichoderma asperellum (strain ATCC 204424 / CBS 433.97 / NBRC 101777) TaxID=1042311 RepID=A0A2T3ZKT7_TRIA4|nr:hypothetical protein M441DRAFT_316953 [Trichoderma asperellum CBS 433.97]PTB45421.1 hypothetical protein M441DRAFT_316953 [Trichoderma asperellum CBS 433.97]
MAPVSRTVFGSGRVMQLSAAPWFSSAKAYPILWERLDNLFSPSWFLGVQVRVSTVSKPKKPKSYTLGAHKLIFFFFSTAGSECGAVWEGDWPERAEHSTLAGGVKFGCRHFDGAHSFRALI